MCLLLSLLLAEVAGATPPPTLTMTWQGTEVELGPEEVWHLVATSERLLRSCNFNSRDDAQLFPAHEMATTVLGSLRIEYGAPRVFETLGGEFVVEELRMDLLPEFPEQPRVRSGDGWHRFTKCSGAETLRLACDPPAPTKLREAYPRSCSVWEAAQAGN